MIGITDWPVDTAFLNSSLKVEAVESDFWEGLEDVFSDELEEIIDDIHGIVS